MSSAPSAPDSATPPKNDEPGNGHCRLIRKINEWIAEGEAAGEKRHMFLFSQRGGITNGALTKYLQGKQLPTLPTLYAAAKFFKVPIHDLIDEYHPLYESRKRDTLIRNGTSTARKSQKQVPSTHVS